MLKKFSVVSVLLVMPLLLLTACGTAQQRAQKKLEQRGIQFTEDAFVETAFKGDSDALKLFLDAGMNPNTANHDGRPALVAAALEGRETVVDQLLDARADVNAKTREGQTALMGAAVNGNPRVVNILLSRGADFNLKDAHDFTALMYADGAHKPEVRDVLVKAGAKDWHPGPLQTPENRIPLPNKKTEKS